MLKNKIRAIVPIVALVLVAACSDSTGPGAPELAEIQQESPEQDQANRIRGIDTDTKRKTPLDQEREDRER